MNKAQDLEYHRARAIAQEYRSKGYEVVVEPSREQLPGFLAGYHPDLLLCNSEESVVVEVKARRSLSSEMQAWRLAKLLRDQPGWRFELAIVDTGEYLDIPRNSCTWNKEDIRSGIKTAERLLADGLPEPALMSAWAALEASVRLLTEEESGKSADLPTSAYVLTAAVHEGAIDRDDYFFLSEALKTRNALAHGYAPADFNPQLVVDLMDLTKRYLEQPLADLA